MRKSIIFINLFRYIKKKEKLNDLKKKAWSYKKIKIIKTKIKLIINYIIKPKHLY